MDVLGYRSNLELNVTINILITKHARKELFYLHYFSFPRLYFALVCLYLDDELHSRSSVCILRSMIESAVCKKQMDFEKMTFTIDSIATPMTTMTSEVS